MAQTSRSSARAPLKRGSHTRSQEARIIEYLATGKPLTPLLALKRWGCLRLGARISDLRRAGHKIPSELVERRGKRFAEYRLQHGR